MPEAVVRALSGTLAGQGQRYSWGDAGMEAAAQGGVMMMRMRMRG